VILEKREEEKGLLERESQWILEILQALRRIHGRFESLCHACLSMVMSSNLLASQSPLVGGREGTDTWCFF
jgi:hypothetical protein